MHNNALRFVLVLAALLPDWGSFAADVLWTNTLGGSWSSGANWNSGAAPGPSDKAMIVNAGSYTVTLDVDATVAALALGGTSGTQSLSVSSHALTVNANSAINESGVMALSSATVGGSGTLTNRGELHLNNAIINCPLLNQGLLITRGVGNSLGTIFENQPGATLRILGDGNFSGAQLTTVMSFTNHGLIELTSVVNAQSATLNMSGTLVNAVGGVINVLLGDGNGGRILAAELDNEGVLSVGAGLSINKSSAAHINSGSILLTNGDVALNQSGSPATFSSTGNIDIGSGLFFIVSGGTLNYNGGSIGGPGTLSLNGATANFMLDFSDASTALSLTSATLNGPGRVTNAVGKTIRLDNGTINASLVNEGILICRGVGNNLGGAFDNQAGATVRILGDGNFSGAQLTTALGFTNHGLIELTSVVNAQSATLNMISGTLVNAIGGVINVLPGDGNGGRILAVELDNEGVLSVGAGLSINKSSAAHMNSGSILLTNGDLAVSQSGSPATFSSTGNIDIGSGLSFIVSGGTLNYNGGSIGGPGTLNLNGATANFVPDFSDVSTALSLTSATLNGPGRVTNAVGKTIRLDNGNINATLVNEGLLIFRGVGNSLGGAFDNQAGATVRILGDGNFSGAQLTTAMGFTNHGLIELTSVVNAQSATLNVISGTLVNAAVGVINVLAGDGNGGRILNAELDNEGILSVGAGLSINKSSAAHLNGGSILLTNGDVTVTQSGSPATFSSTGTIDIGNGLSFIVSGGTLNYNAGTISGTGTLSLNSVTANFVPDFSDASTALSLTSATLNGPGRVTNAFGKTIHLDNGSINATLINEGLLIFRGVGNNLGSAFDNQAGATVRILGDGNFSGAQLTSALGFTNRGLIELTSVVNAQSATLNVSSGTLVNAVGGVINVLSGAGNGGRILGVDLDNQGILNVGANLSISKNLAVITDAGTINVSAGQTLQVNGSRLQINPGGVLQGDGTLDAKTTVFTNAGSINPGVGVGVFSILGGYPQAAGGAVNIQIGGRNAGVDYDQLRITGDATLNGSLNISLTNGFRPSGGDTFEVVQYEAHSLAFDHINGLNLGGGLFLQPLFSSTNLVLVTVDTRPQVVFETPKLLPGGVVQITLNGTAGRDFVIEATTNLSPATWIPVVSTTNAGAFFNLTLFDATNFPARFFRFKQ